MQEAVPIRISINEELLYSILLNFFYDLRIIKLFQVSKLVEVDISKVAVDGAYIKHFIGIGIKIIHSSFLIEFHIMGVRYITDKICKI
jgi:hypothetical protein